MVTLEGLVETEEVEKVKKELKEILNKESGEKDEMVVSLSTSPSKANKTTPEMQKIIQEIIDFCRHYELRIYSYRY
ncbi:MAG: hypothetical protein GY950_01750 [bacterium]|nr:hypothetical protein [bacterium]